ncbi:CAP domain-containing protein [Mucilaginibacter hurinus]|uniref:CAP domain-containing protein n=1 Tax=Mucilaginibacter hurinus TaxID=2201324 RepID=A0A367GTI2_9SPHI|nr:CAP domain-containing protein [Mucilaginibacter hurinus]RCH56013.1 CAP domain-containing protein [Mucilaginibacter hurinus]
MKTIIWRSAILLTVFITLGSLTIVQNNDTTEFKDDFLSRINSVRQAGCKCGTQYMPPVAPLAWSDELERAAKNHASDMAARRYFNHTSKDGSTSYDRITRAGYTMKGYRSIAVGENIAFGQQSIAEVQNGWFKSPGHCKNLMNADFKEVGVAHDRTYWVQNFGGREEFTRQQKLMIKKGARLVERKGY